MPDDFDGFLKLEGITSESKDPAHKDWIDVESFSFGCEVSDFTIGAAGILVADDPTVAPWVFTQGMHRGSPTLFQFCVNGIAIPTAEFHVRKAGGDNPFVYFKVKFTDCLITNLTTSTEGKALPMETLTIAFRAASIAPGRGGLGTTGEAGDGGRGHRSF